MNPGLRTVNYGAMAYIIVILAMVVGFVATFVIVSPIVDTVFSLVGGLIEQALGLFGF
jgi:hypothetical protein